MIVRFAAELPWVPEVFLARGGITLFGRRSKRERRSRNKGLTETGNRVRKVSGTQGTVEHKRTENYLN